jgi:SPP1 gp7 family putative phage head morphogenesis protein
MDYWEMRAARRLEQNEAGAKESLRVLGKAFARAQKDILEDMERLERTMGKKYDLTPMEVRELLEKPCGREEYLRLLERIEQLPRGAERTALMAQAAAPAYTFRRSRLEALRDQTRARTAMLAGEYEQQITGQLGKTVREAYLRAGFDAQARIGYAAPFAAMNEGAVRRILQAPWSGMHFSKRIWQNQEALTELLNETITSGFMTGRSVKSMIAEVQEKMGVAYRAAERLVRTENAAMVAMADKAAYKAARIKRYRFMATLDSLTSKICMTLDNEIFDVDEMVIGKNCPPMHPHCRSTTTAVIDGVDLSEAQRRSKDPATGMPVRVPRSMSYGEWEKVQQETYGMTPAEVDKHKGYLYHEDGTVFVTDDWKQRTGHFSIPRTYKPYAVIETLSGKVQQTDRTFYDGNGVMSLQVHGGSHSRKTIYTNYGAHAHDYTDGKRVAYEDGRDGRDLTKEEVIQNADIIPNS